MSDDTVHDEEFHRILDVVRHALVTAKAETTPIGFGEIEPESPLSDPPISLDSLEYVSMLVALEERLGMMAEDEDFFGSSVRTVEDLIGVVRRRLGERA